MVSIFILATVVFFIITVLVISLLILACYNSMIKKDQLLQEALSGVDVQLKRRRDLIPNLVEVVRAYGAYESDTFQKVIKLRSLTQSPERSPDAEVELSATLKTFFAVTENYPELKANVNFLELQNSLQKVEEHIHDARRYYNANVREFNSFINTFPNSIIASKFRFTVKKFYGVDSEEDRNNVVVTL